jgi:hypothetical protein
MDEVIQIASQAIIDKGYNNENGIFKGTVNKSGFRAHRVIKYSNALLPFIYGDFLNNEQGVYIKITLAPALSSIIFLAIWYALSAYVIIRSFIIMLATGQFDSRLLFGVGMAIFVYLVSMFWWNLEKGKALRFVIGLFAHISNQRE